MPVKVKVKVGLNYLLVKLKNELCPAPLLYHNQHNMSVKVKIGLNLPCKAKEQVIPTPIPSFIMV
jgi:hypothetical protein